MEKLDHLGWVEGLAFDVYGLKIGIRINLPGYLDRVLQLLPPGWKVAKEPYVQHLFSLRIGKQSPSRQVRNYHLLYEGLTRLERTLDLDQVFEALESHLHFHCAGHAQNRVFVHAGVVSWKGRAILLPGRSFAGKSTLVAALLRAGAIYYSDEFAVFDKKGQVHPFPRQLMLRNWDGNERTRRTPEQLGSRPGTTAIPVGLVAMLRYRPGVSWRPKTLPPGQTVLELLQHTVPVRKEPQRVLKTLQKVVPKTVNLSAFRGEAEETAGKLLAILQEQSSHNHVPAFFGLRLPFWECQH